MIVCLCNNVTEEDIKNENYKNAGQDCGTCVSYIKQLVKKTKEEKRNGRNCRR